MILGRICSYTTHLNTLTWAFRASDIEPVYLPRLRYETRYVRECCGTCTDPGNCPRKTPMIVGAWARKLSLLTYCHYPYF